MNDSTQPSQPEQPQAPAVSAGIQHYATPTSTADINKRFTYHPPRGNQPARYEFLRDKARDLAHLINQLVPDSREKSSALTHLDMTVMFANAAIARNE